MTSVFLTTGLIVAGCIAGIIILLLVGWIISCLVRRLYPRQIDETSPDLRNHNEPNNSCQPDLYYTADQFEHQGPLVVVKDAKFRPEAAIDTELDNDLMPPDSHFYFTEKEGNVVYDIGSKVEVIR